jgi:hypothetical protein
VELEHDLTSDVRIEALSKPFEPERMSRLRDELERCPDVAFAHLPQVLVHGRQARPEPALFVWLVPEAVSSLRPALNAVSEIVARVLPRNEYLDVVVLNSAPELLEAVEAAGCLVAERDAEERRRALAAAQRSVDERPPPTPRTRPWWWPF